MPCPSQTYYLPQDNVKPDFEMHIKQEMDHDPHQYYTTSNSPSDTPIIPLYSVTNENWRGKNDPTERRRIQNRINQRAFRQRQRAGEVPKQYTARGKSAQRIKQEEDEQACPLEDEFTTTASEEETSPGPSEPQSVDQITGFAWDELGRLINGNFNSAVEANAQLLGIELGILKSVATLLTPRPAASSHIPSSLWPFEAQHRVAHDPYLDAIPHPRLRYNILNAIHHGQLEPTDLAVALRNSGGLEPWQGAWQRVGLVVWSSPESIENWEVTEAFVRKWLFLLQGCEDLLAATNQWRLQRGEQPFQLNL